MVDEAWSVLEESAFAWWPHEHAQRIFVSEPYEDAGVVGRRLRAETDVLRGAPGADRAAVDRTLADLMRFPPMSGFVRDEEGSVRLFSGVFVHEALAPFAISRFVVSAVLAATYAELGSAALSEATGLPPFVSAHPTTGRRPHPDGLLNLAAARLAPEGKGASRFSEPAELLAVAEELAALGARASAHTRGVDARFPFRKDVAEPFAPRSSSLLQIRTAAPHPELGSGVFLRLFLPVFDADASRALRLDELERSDARFACASLGAWCLDSSEPERVELPVLSAPPRLCHVTFLPNALYASGALRNLAVDEGQRALFAAHVFSHGEASR